MQHDSDRGDNDDEAGHNLGNADTAEHLRLQGRRGLVAGSSLITERWKPASSGLRTGRALRDRLHAERRGANTSWRPSICEYSGFLIFSQDVVCPSV